jgi:thiol-disulfide isomerase/thioredoxin
MTERSTDKSASGRRLPLIAVAVVAGLAAGLAVIYGIAGFQSNNSGACSASTALTAKLKPLAHGEVAAVNVPDRPLLIPDLAFHDAAGAQKHLADWRGRIVLLNLWATWCVPCRQEMPALEALQKKAGGPQFEVVAINIDTRDADKPRSWLKEVGVERLGYYADPQAKVFQDLKAVGRAFGMPTTVLIDKNGCELGTIAGPADWSSDDALKLIETALGVRG